MSGIPDHAACMPASAPRQDKQKAEEAAAAGEERKPLYAKTQSLCCIDYPRVVEILQLRIHLMRKKLKVSAVC